MALLDVRNLKKVYTTRLGSNQVQALSNVNFSVEQGEYVAIMGESGSGLPLKKNHLSLRRLLMRSAVLLRHRQMNSVSIIQLTEVV